MGTALEMDIYSNVNSSHVFGIHLRNGMGRHICHDQDRGYELQRNLLASGAMLPRVSTIDF